jgi:multimeric flavodoxin WrbA
VWDLVRILGISASPRVQSNTDILLNAALDSARSLGAETKFVALRDLVINPCDGHVDCGARAECAHQDDFPLLMDEFLSYEGVILATPVYFWNVTAQMKTFIDRHYFSYKHQKDMEAKAAGIIVLAGSSGIEETEQTMKAFVLKGVRFKRPDTLHLMRAVIGSYAAANDKPDLIEHARALGRNVFLGANH